MKAVIFGATGMVGQGVLRECLLDPEVERVLSVVRNATGQHHEKLRELVHGDFLDFSGIEGELAGYDACFFCLGVVGGGDVGG
ncbi:MAG: NAD-dependent epimerase/dehydratase family protein [Silvibacterium sp.]